MNPIGPPGTVQPPQQIDPASGALTKLKAYPMGRNPDRVEIVDL